MLDLLIDLFSEEIPARMQADAARDILAKLTSKIQESELSFDSAEAFYGPRRLTFSITGLPYRQPDRIEERKGPKENAPDLAIQGFLRGAGLESLNQAELRETGKGKVWFAIQHISGRETATLLPDLLIDVIQEHTWPKSQRWARTTFRWVRPLHRILAVFDGKPLKGGIRMNAKEFLPFTNRAEGHRFLSQGSFEVTGLEVLEEGLKDRYCLLRAEDRKATITDQLATMCTKANLCLIEDAALLNEVAGLVEWPVVIQGAFDVDFLTIPEECLILSMKEHQKYFAARKPDGTLAPVFFAVINMIADDNSAVIRAGNERVLKARLSDAKFFYEQDLTMSLKARLPKLDHIVYHEKLGSLGDKVKRETRLSSYLAQKLHDQFAKQGNLKRLEDLEAVSVETMTIAKADLVSAMVCEFPELQGLMGKYYALYEGLDTRTANAIADQRKPAGPQDMCPSAPISLITALSDKIDTLAGFWSINQKPTGSKDPFALRRTALGLIRLIRENGLRLDIHEAISFALIPLMAFKPMSQSSLKSNDGQTDIGDIADSALTFITERLAIQLRHEGAAFDVVNAVRFGVPESDLIRFVKRAQTTQDRLTDDLIAAYKRASNMLDKSKGWQHTTDRPSANNADQTFARELDCAVPKLGQLMDTEDFSAVFDTLSGLRQAIDQYVNAVMINAEDPVLRNQRLSMLADFVDAVNQIANLSKLEG